MLKNTSHQKNPVEKKNIDPKFMLTDEQVKLYIDTFFEVSPRHDNGTAPANEWLQFLKLYNEREGHYILTDPQMDAIRPYCEINADVEMIPEDFIRLIHLIRHGHMQPPLEEEEITPQMSVSTKQLFDARPRSSKLASKSYYRGSKSPNHPITDDDFSVSSRKSGYSNDDFSNHHNTIYTEFDSGNLVEILKRDKLAATKQIRDYESRIQSLESEHSIRIAQLQTKCDNICTESGHLKSLISSQKNKERERLDKISELHGIISDLDVKLSSTLKKQQTKEQQVDIYKDRLIKLEDLYNTTNQKLSEITHRLSQEQEIVRVLQLEKSRTQSVSEDEQKIVADLKEKLEDQYAENQSLLEVIEKQQNGMEERALLSYKTTPISNQGAESSLAQERAEADIKDYKDKIAKLEQQIKDSEAQRQQDQQTIDEYLALQNGQDILMNKLATNFTVQQRKMSAIEKAIIIKNKIFHNRFAQFITIIARVFLLYHIITIVINVVLYGPTNNVRVNPLFSVFNSLEDWFTI